MVDLAKVADLVLLVVDGRSVLHDVQGPSVHFCVSVHVRVERCNSVVFA